MQNPRCQRFNEATGSVSSYDIWDDDIKTPTGTTGTAQPSIVESNPDENAAFAAEPRVESPPIPDIDSSVTSIPEPGQTYMIRHMDSGNVLTLADGILTLSLIDNTRGGWHWHCVELPNGWIGFREAVSGMYLGRDNKGGYRATVKKMSWWESFALRPREGGGINLLVNYSPGLKAMDVVERNESSVIVNAPNSAAGARWEFIKV